MQKAKGQVLAVLGISGIRAISGNWAQMGPKYHKSWLGRHSKSLKVFNSSFHIK